jgi:hypothetical protein
MSAQKYHKNECAVMPFIKQHFNERLVVALKVIAATDIEELTKLADTTLFTKPTSEEDWRTVGFDERGKYSSGIDGVLSFYHKKQWTSTELLHSCIFTSVISKVLHIDQMSSQSKLEGFILKLLHCFNNMKTHHLSEFQMYEEGARYIMLGYYSPPIINLMKHSCNPNVFIHHHKTTSVVRAVQVIPQGSQLVISYGRAFLRRPMQERKAYLEANTCLGCPCTCEACVYDWPLLDDLPEGPMFELPDEKKAMDSVAAGAQLITDKHFDGEWYVVTKQSLPVFLKQIIIMDKCNKKLNQRYFEMVELVREYFAVQGNLFLNFDEH